MITAKQNQKFSFLNFRFSAGGVGGADKKWKGNFWFLLPRPKGADEAREIRAYDLVSNHHALRACHIICFESKCELGTLETPIRNSTAFSKPEGGTGGARPPDFPPFFQTNSDSRLRRDGLFFRRGGGAKSEAILTHSIYLIQKDFLSL